MTEQSSMMVKVRRAVAKAVTRSRRSGDVHSESGVASSSPGTRGAGLAIIIQMTAKAATKGNDKEKAMASPFVASCLRLLLQLSRVSNDLAAMVGSSCDDRSDGNGWTESDSSSENGDRNTLLLPILSLMRGGWVLNKKKDNVQGNIANIPPLVSPRAIRQTNTVMHSQEVELVYSEQRSTAQGLALLLARELIQCCNNLRQASCSVQSSFPSSSQS